MFLLPALEPGHPPLRLLRGHDAAGAQGVPLPGDIREERAWLPRRPKRTPHGPRAVRAGGVDAG